MRNPLIAAIILAVQIAAFAQDPCGRKLNPISPRLERFRAWLIKEQVPCSTFTKELNTRMKMFADTARCKIDTSSVSFIGESGTPVQIIMVVSMTCPLCKLLYAQMYREVTAGVLKGKARMAVKPFSSRPVDVALVAAADWRKQPQLLLSLEPVKERVTLEIIRSIMKRLGADSAEFDRRIGQDDLKQRAAAWADEAHRNGVDRTPTFFINGRRYQSYKDTQWVIDAAEFEYERLTAKTLPRTDP